MGVLVLGLGIESSGSVSIIGSEISNAAGAHLTELSIFALSAILDLYYICSIKYCFCSNSMSYCRNPCNGIWIQSHSSKIIAAGLGTSMSSAIPSITPPMAISYSSKKVTILNMFKTDMVSDLSRLMILILLGPFFDTDSPLILYYNSSYQTEKVYYTTINKKRLENTNYFKTNRRFENSIYQFYD